MTMSQLESHPIEEQQSADDLFAVFRRGYEAFGQLLEFHRKYLLKIINDEVDPHERGRAGGSDIVQTAFLNVVKHVNTTSNGLFAVDTKEDLKAWLRRVCKNAIYKEHDDQIREKRDVRREQPLPDGFEKKSEAQSPSSEFRQRENNEALQRAINDLPESDRVLFRLKSSHGWSDMALAELLDGRASDAGRMRIQRRLNKLLLRLADDPRIEECQ
jgi:RNA polymerase sigma factor (sigma-70 family)